MKLLSNEDIRAIILRTIEYEGGYVNDPHDPGGETKFGISKRAHPHLDIPNLTLEDAINVYADEYFYPLRLNEIVDVDIAGEIFDTAVNMGKGGAVSIIKQALQFLGEDVSPTVSDGIDDYILGLINKWCAKDVLALFKVLNGVQFVRYYNLVKNNPSLKRYARGWMKRIQQLG